MIKHRLKTSQRVRSSVSLVAYLPSANVWFQTYLSLSSAVHNNKRHEAPLTSHTTIVKSVIASSFRIEGNSIKPFSLSVTPVELVLWRSEPSQPSGLKTTFSRSLSHSVHKLLNTNQKLHQSTAWWHFCRHLSGNCFFSCCRGVFNVRMPISHWISIFSSYPRDFSLFASVLTLQLDQLMT